MSLIPKDHEDYALLSRLHQAEVLSPDDLQQYLYLEGLCQQLGVFLKADQLLLLLYGQRSSFFADLLTTQFEVLDAEDPVGQFLNLRLAPEDEVALLKECDQQGLLEAQALQQAQSIHENAKIMGLDLPVAEILVLQAKIPDDMAQRWKQTANSTGQRVAEIPLNPYTLKSGNRVLCPSLVKLALLNGLIDQSTVSRIQNLQQQLRQEFDLVLPPERLLFEVGLIDRRHIQKLLQVLLRLSRKLEFERELCLRLTPEGDRLLEKKLKAAKQLKGDQLKQARNIQKALAEIELQLSLGEILKQQGVLSLSTLESLALGDEMRAAVQPGPPAKFVLKSAMSNVVDVLLASKIITSEQLTKSQQWQQHFQQKYAFNLPIEKWLVLQGAVNETTLNEIQVAKQWLQVRQSLEYIYLSFNPAEVRLLQEIVGTTWEEIGRSEKFRAFRQLARDRGMAWDLAEYLFFQGKIPRSAIEKVLLQRKTGASAEFFEFPAWGHDDDPQTTMAKLAVANHYLTTEEYHECLAIRQSCQAQWGFYLPLEQIMLKKGYLSAAELKPLMLAYYKNRYYTQCSSYYYYLSLAPEQEKRIMQRAQEQPAFSAQLLEQTTQIAQILAEQGVRISPAKLLLLRTPGASWLAADIREELLNQLGWQDHPLAPSLPRPPSLRMSQQAAEGKRWKLLEQHLLQKQLLGQLAVEQGVLSALQVNDALFLQRCLQQMGLQVKIGEVLVDLGLLSPPLVQKLLAIQQSRLQSIQWPPNPFLTEQDYVLCQTVLEYKTTSPIDVKRSLYIQKQMREMKLNVSLRSILQRTGMLDETILRGQLSTFQKQVKTLVEGAPPEKTSPEPSKSHKPSGTIPAKPRETPRSEKAHATTRATRVHGAVIGVRRPLWSQIKVPVLIFTLPIILCVVWFTIATSWNTVKVHRQEIRLQQRRKKAKNRAVTKKAICPLCKGKKWIVEPCKRCRHTGKIPCFKSKKLRCKNGYLQVLVGKKWYWLRKPTGFCPRCKGVLHSEACPGYFGEKILCPYCKGKGYRVCPNCNGKGTIRYRCPRCNPRKKPVGKHKKY